MLTDEYGLFHINKLSRALVAKFEKLGRFRVLLFLYLYIHIDLLLFRPYNLLLNGKKLCQDKRHHIEILFA